jgi:hypothetical protein
VTLAKQCGKTSKASSYFLSSFPFFRSHAFKIEEFNASFRHFWLLSLSYFAFSSFHSTWCKTVIVLRRAIFHGKKLLCLFIFLMFVYILKNYVIKNGFHSKKKLKFLQRKMSFLFSILDNSFWIFNKKLIISLIFFLLRTWN